MSFLKNYFQLNKREERGIFILILLIIFIAILRYFAPLFFSVYYPENNQDVSFTKLMMENVETKEPFKKSVSYQKVQEKLEIHLAFDPNTIPLEDLIEMKLPAYIARNWDNYRNAGAKFRKETDILKIYGMDSSYYQQINNFLVFPEPPQVSQEQMAEVTPKVVEEEGVIEYKASLSIGLNSADSVELLNVNGIGPFYAGAIIQYRERLGGFIDMKQLMELYKMDSIKYQKMTSQLFLDSIPLQTISINQDSFKRILRHPYIDYKTTKYIVNKRQRLGKYSALYQLMDSVHLPPEKYQQILPYLRLD